jgi:hypothetical protein
MEVASGRAACRIARCNLVDVADPHQSQCAIMLPPPDGGAEIV